MRADVSRLSLGCVPPGGWRGFQFDSVFGLKCVVRSVCLPLSLSIYCIGLEA